MGQGKSRYILFTAFLFTSLFASTSLGSGGVRTDYYHVVGNKVDQKTFLGWSLFHNNCVGCHGVGGSGTSRAPDLTISVGRMSAGEFERKVLERYLISVPQGETTPTDHTALREALLAEIRKQEERDSGGAVMPKWKHNPIVKDRVQNLYSYLKARSDGVLDEDKPGLLKE